VRTGGIINAQLARVLAELRHTDLIVIADSGLPVDPGGPEVVDLAVVYGVPAFETVFRAVAAEIVVEGAVAAGEIADANPECWRLLRHTLDVDVELTPHEDFKAKTAEARAVVRTGEATPYANVLLRCGVPFAPR
jgi:D-ribose pyranase